ncbi:MAG: hypothetical protein ABIP79_02935, partial [Chitinophagaceae bacterium]
VKAEMCKLPEDYKYSSALFYETGVDNWNFLEHYRDLFIYMSWVSCDSFVGACLPVGRFLLRHKAAHNIQQRPFNVFGKTNKGKRINKYVLFLSYPV